MQVYVYMIRRKKPPAPKPIKIDRRSVFHRPEKISWCRVFKGPSLRILLKRLIE
jgi:hypothetical protein